MKVINKKDNFSFDPGKLSPMNKVLLYPILIKIFGIFKATVILYGKSKNG